MRNVNKYLYDGESILLPRKGSLDNIQFVNGKFWTVDTIFYSVINKKIANPYYLFRYLNSLDLSGLDSGASIPSMTSKTYYKIEVTMPSLNYQNKVASILSSYDELIETNNKRIALLEESARELYKEWFVRFRFPGHEHTKFVKGLPEGWEEARIDKYYNTGSGGTPKSNIKEYYEDGTIRWVNTGELHDNYLLDTNSKITQKGLSKSAAKMYPANTIVIAMYGATIGQLGIMAEECCTNQACCCLTPKTNDFGNEFIFLSLYMYRPFLISLGFGAAQQNISQDEIKKYKIVFPNKELANEFSKRISNIFETVKILQKENASLSSARDRLLPRLISGKLKV